ncbi:c-type cytochrome [Cyclobacteriaceae bacterium]|nr:c-type cytochrome [Cyclobacteriaceae bacterium]MDB4315911.1 c-type cytochrome [Cyclobacteriaceae bacterium]MDB4742453.1 c-type cytochrome [Cyclobacteriaceae bacterium]
MMKLKRVLIKRTKKATSFGALFVFVFFGCTGLSGCSTSDKLVIAKGARISLIGNNLGARMMHYGFFETEAQLKFPDSLIVIRNLCDGGNTPGFRPHSGRNEPWAFPGADQFQDDLAQKSGSEGHFETPDQWLDRLDTDLIIGFFGFNESFEDSAGLTLFIDELHAFITHTQAQKYNGMHSPELVLVSPIAFQDLSKMEDLPDGIEINRRLKMYTHAMAQVALEEKIFFIDVYTPSIKWFSEKKLTIDGMQLNEEGYRIFSSFLSNTLFGQGEKGKEIDFEELRARVLDKNWYWQNDFKMPNGVHVFGRRYDPFGSDNYPDELKKIRELTQIRDTAIWSFMQNSPYDVALADGQTQELAAVETNYRNTEEVSYLYGEEALATLTVPKGYEIELFASEETFPDLANPVQLSFDDKGRLWVATMPSYPHYKPGDAKPNDKLLILEDTNGDGKADQQTVFADGLHLPIGFELAAEGVYISQGNHLKLYKDVDGDDRADEVEMLLSGFDDHDTHHAISAFTVDPSGAIYMGEGVFLHTNVETPYGPVRATNGGFYRYTPQQHKLERTAQLSIPNPWGIAFDAWGQNFFCDTSGPDVRWMMPGSIKSTYGISSPKSQNLIEEAHRVRPTSGLEFVSSRHFPEEVQGDLLINNTIGFLGTKQHKFIGKGTGYESKHRQDLIVGTDPNFRPVDMEFAPDGSLYIVDWHNVLVGHMQHNARDPLRDHAHGRIYRVTYPSRPLVVPASIDGVSIAVLLDHLKLPEYRTRYRSRRALRGKDADLVSAALKVWVANLDPNDQAYDHHLLEALWVSWGNNQIDLDLLDEVFHSENHRLRAAAVRVMRYMGVQIPRSEEWIIQASADPHGQVRLEAIVAASWLDEEVAQKVLSAVARLPLDDWMRDTYNAVASNFGILVVSEMDEQNKSREERVDLEESDLELYHLGKSIYAKDGYCATCHQVDGKGIKSAGFPPLKGTQWVLGDEERLIKITLNGVMGKMEVMEKSYSGKVPMMAFGSLLNDREIAGVLTYVRNSFGNKAAAISPEKVKQVREDTKDKKGYYLVEELE